MEGVSQGKDQAGGTPDDRSYPDRFRKGDAPFTKDHSRRSKRRVEPGAYSPKHSAETPARSVVEPLASAASGHRLPTRRGRLVAPSPRTGFADFVLTRSE